MSVDNKFRLLHHDVIYSKLIFSDDFSVWTLTNVRNNLSPFVTQPRSAKTLLDHSNVPARKATWVTPSRAVVNLEVNASTTGTVLRPRLVVKAVVSILASDFAELMLSVPLLIIRYLICYKLIVFN